VFPSGVRFFFITRFIRVIGCKPCSPFGYEIVRQREIFLSPVPVLQKSTGNVLSDI